ncbi:MAG: amidohydrolase family protein [Polyangiales bacterium]
MVLAKYPAAFLLLTLAACGSDPTPGSDGSVGWLDGSVDAPDRDAGPPFDGGRDFDAGPPPADAGTPDVPPRPDAGPRPVESVATPPGVVSGSGDHLVLQGTLLLPDGPLEGDLRIEDGLITCAAASCPRDNATLIVTNGVISPGLIDSHNHLAYDFIPEWEPDPVMLYNNRYEWSDEGSYEAHIAPYADNRSRNTTFCPSALWGEARAVVHGTTLMMGQSFDRTCTAGGMRNADHKHRLGYNHMRTSIASVRDINDDAAESLVSSFTDSSEPKTRFAVHMQEGLMGSNLELEFESFAGRDTRNNRHMGTSLLAGDGYFGVGLLIHSMGLTTGQLMEAIDTGAHIVWSPSSNLVLYGDTAPIEEMLDLAIDVALAPDWTVSGADNMLEEMRFASGYGIGQSIDELTPEMIWRMSTSNAAEAVGLADSVGMLEVGMHADIVVFGREAMDPYSAVLDSRAEDIRLTLIEGRAHYGDMNLEAAAAVNGSCEVFDACGNAKFLCIADLPDSDGDWADDTLEDLRGQLQTIIDEYADSDPPLSYSAPLPLVECR